MPRPKKIQAVKQAAPVVEVTEEYKDDDKAEISIKVIPPMNEQGLLPCKCGSYNLGQTYINDTHEDAVIYCNACGAVGPFADGYEQAKEFWNVEQSK